MVKENDIKLEQLKNLWLAAFPELLDLIWTFYCLALDYQLPWAVFWPERWTDWEWLKKAMEQTFVRLNPEDKAALQSTYENFLKNIERYNQEAALHSNI